MVVTRVNSPSSQSPQLRCVFRETVVVEEGLRSLCKRFEIFELILKPLISSYQALGEHPQGHIGRKNKLNKTPLVFSFPKCLTPVACITKQITDG